MEDVKKTQMLRHRLDILLLKLVKPEGMSIDEYRIACNLQGGFDATVEYGPFLHWILMVDGDDSDVVEKVKSVVINALNGGYLLDKQNIKQCSYFCDAIRDLVLKDKYWCERLLEAILGNDAYRGTDVYDYCKTLNKAFGFTSVGYFNGPYRMNKVDHI